MNLEQSIYVTHKNSASTQAQYMRVIIIVGLVAILLAIVVGYIYAGMWIARQPVPAVITDVVPTATPLSEQEIMAQRQAVLEAVDAQVVSSDTLADRQVVLESIDAQVVSSDTFEERQAVLEAVSADGLQGIE